MPEHVVKPSLSFAKLVATPTDVAWSQAYNAGNLFACLSLTSENPLEEMSLQTLGKESLSILESEFFTLEEKTTETIKKAIVASLEKIPPEVKAQFTVANFKDNILTVFIAGSGKIVLKRGEKIGVLLEKYADYEPEEVSSASGYVEHNDTLILQTGQFAHGISEETVSGALDLSLPNDIVEALSPQVLEQDNGAQAAIVITYHGGALPQQIISHDLAEPEDQTIASLYSSDLSETLTHAEEDTDESDDEQPSRKKFPTLHIPHVPQIKLHLNHRRKLYLTIAIILALLLFLSIFLSVKKQNDQKQQEAFESIYKSAQQYYQEGQGLESLNKSLSHDSYVKAENKLKESNGKISKGSEEDKKIQELLAKVEAALQGAPAQGNSNAKETNPPENSLLAIAKDNPSALGFGQDESSVYFITDKAVTSVSKGSGTKKEVIKNDSAWTSPQDVMPYQGNTYILDQKNGVLKFVNNSSKSSYFQGDSPDLSKATGMAIDGSIWIVTKDGKVLKFTKGHKDSFGLSGLDKPLNAPTKILTSLNMDSVYIMDNGNRRILKVSKKGVVQKSYETSEIAGAKAFDISIKDNTLLILNNNKVFAMPL